MEPFRLHKKLKGLEVSKADEHFYVEGTGI